MIAILTTLHVVHIMVDNPKGFVSQDALDVALSVPSISVLPRKARVAVIQETTKHLSTRGRLRDVLFLILSPHLIPHTRLA